MHALALQALHLHQPSAVPLSGAGILLPAALNALEFPCLRWVVNGIERAWTDMGCMASAQCAHQQNQP